MPLLLNRQHPYLRIYNPANEQVIAFYGGSLVIEPDDENFACVMAEAGSNPDIEVWDNSATCPVCGRVVGKGMTAAASLAGHMGLEHPDASVPEASGPTLLKSQASYSCDVCRPAQVFEDDRALAAHAKAIHAGAPTFGPDGEALESGPAPTKGRRRPGEVSPIPAARQR